MLYELWLQVARRYSDRLALTDLPGGRCWSFRELAEAAEAGEGQAGARVFPLAQGPEFILALLRAWRHHQVVCPLEPGQSHPEVAGELPPGIVHLKLTSATGGTCRLVAFRPEQLAADAENIVLTMGLRVDWPNLASISLAHSYGFSNLVLPLLLHGIPLILLGNPLPETVRSAMAGGDALTLAAVPALWRAWHEAGVISENIKLAISAGAPLPLGLEQAVYATRGLKIHNFYGSSETGGLAYDDASLPRTDAACVGAPLRNVKLAIGREGCVEVRSRAVAECYWPATAGELGRGRFRTSDLGEIIGGKVYLRGRANDLMNVAGRKVSPDAVERVLGAHPQVSDCLVFGAPSPGLERGDVIVACLATRGEVTREELRQFLLADLPAWQVPREWWFVSSLETSARGKLSREVWRQRFLELTSGGQPLSASGGHIGIQEA